MYLGRASAELESAEILFRASHEEKLRDELLAESTFYSGVISHAYYSIFYCAKAMLLTKKIETEAPNVHKKTFDEFKKSFVDTGILDSALLVIYRRMIVRADALLEIYREEKQKRGDFTYNTIPQANKQPAEESVDNAKKFLKHSNAYMAEHQKE